jgi:FlaA1/EpsC-like NDP-sugar epimerase
MLSEYQIKQDPLPNRNHLHVLPFRLIARQLQVGVDLMVLVLAFQFSYLLRFDFSIPAEELQHNLARLLLVVLVQLVTLKLVGVYSFIWRYVGMTELRAFVSAAILSCVPLLILRLSLPYQFQKWQVPISIILMDTIFAFSGVLGVRIIRRILYERSARRKKQAQTALKNRIPVLLIGAGRAGMLVAREIGRGNTDLLVKGFVDDDLVKEGTIIHGIKVLGTTDDLPRLVSELNVDHVVITLAQATRRDFRRILDICEKLPIKVKTIPGLYEILQGKVKVSRIRDLQIEDLLGRDPVQLDQAQMERFISGKTVMVTGAGGSIGSELARQLARLRPKKLLLVERAEFALFEIDRELSKLDFDGQHISLIADVTDEPRIRDLFDTYHPQVVFHAAAHKHVPLMELNTAEAVKNNVLATHKLGQIAGEFGVEAFVLISTDKAVRPTSVMGATKRMAELVVQYLNNCFATHYIAVRFGNVIGSAGSVIPIFRDQIRNGGPVTVTHPEMMRYFMTIPEAAQLVLQAGSMGEGGEIFILDMGEPVRILDLAKEAITLSGLKPFEDIEILFTGKRPGEKLFEELEMTQERVSKTRHPKIFVGKIAPYPAERITYALSKLGSLAQNGCDSKIRMLLNELLPEAKIEVKESDSGKPSAKAMAVTPESMSSAIAENISREF